MRILITGANGQLGWSLQQTAPAGMQLICTDIADLDICDSTAVENFIVKHRPDAIFNAAAYTAVDKAETEEDIALRINATAVSNLGIAAQKHGARLIHVSTDFVFDGVSGIPYPPDALTAPISAYGRTKLAGEQAALAVNALIVRTAWVYGSKGHNFVRTMLRLMSERDEVRVVADQIGTPAFATGLAEVLWALDTAGATGIYHHTDSGAASWYDFAVAIQEEATALGILHRVVPIIPIATTDYPTPARRPHFSVLDKTSTTKMLGAPPPHWRENLRRMLQDVKTHG